MSYNQNTIEKNKQNNKQQNSSNIIEALQIETQNKKKPTHNESTTLQVEENHHEQVPSTIISLKKMMKKLHFSTSVKQRGDDLYASENFNYLDTINDLIRTKKLPVRTLLEIYRTYVEDETAENGVNISYEARDQGRKILKELETVDSSFVITKDNSPQRYQDVKKNLLQITREVGRLAKNIKTYHENHKSTPEDDIEEGLVPTSSSSDNGERGPQHYKNPSSLQFISASPSYSNGKTTGNVDNKKFHQDAKEEDVAPAPSSCCCIVL